MANGFLAERILFIPGTRPAAADIMAIEKTTRNVELDTKTMSIESMDTGNARLMIPKSIDPIF
jgi:hypothetical protein